jgi:DNA-binding transcriptional MerR regulator
MSLGYNPSESPWLSPAIDDATGKAQAPLSTIGQMAQEFGITVRSLRFYESRGLISPQRDGSTRLYSPADRDRLVLILTGKRLGFTLREIRQLLATREADAEGGDQGWLKLSRAQCIEQINLLERQKRAIEGALVELRRAYSRLYARALAHEQGPDGANGESTG